MGKPDKQVAQKISSLCGKLKSAWTLQVGFETRLSTLLPEILTLPSDQIDEAYDKATKGDPIREQCMVPIACEHLFHPSLHHRIPGWLEDEALPFRDKVLHAIGRFRLHEFAPCLNRFFFYRREETEYLDALSSSARGAARGTAAVLKSAQNFDALRAGLGWENTAENRDLAYRLRPFPQFDAKPYLQKWFRESQVVDEIGACERYVAGSIGPVEHLRLSLDRHVIWDLAEWYGEHERTEVTEFLVQHLDFTERWFSSPKLSQTILCRGERATQIIAKLNGWMPREHEHRSFIASLWQALKADPSLAFQPKCPVSYDALPKDKTHLQLTELFRAYDRVLHHDGEFGFSLRQSDKNEDVVLAFQVPGWEHWRIVRLNSSDHQLLQSGEVPVAHLFHRYSSRGALVAYADQVIFNASDFENKSAAKAIKKLKKRQERDSQRQAALSP